MRVIDDPGCFAITDRYWLRHGSAESASDKALIKFGILVVLHPNPGYHIRFSVGKRLTLIGSGRQLILIGGKGGFRNLWRQHGKGWNGKIYQANRLVLSQIDTVWRLTSQETTVVKRLRKSHHGNPPHVN